MQKREAPALPTEILVGLIVAFNAIVRLRYLDLPLERDEGEYAYAGQLLLQGIPPYQLVYNMKFPGTYAAYALIETLLGQSTDAIRIALIVITSATALLVYLLGARLFGRGAGMAAAAAYVLLSLSLASQGLYAHATHFVVLWGRKLGRIQVMDPARGRRWVSPEQLADELYVHEMDIPAEMWREAKQKELLVATHDPVALRTMAELVL